MVVDAEEYHVRRYRNKRFDTYSNQSCDVCEDHIPQRFVLEKYNENAMIWLCDTCARKMGVLW